MRCSQLFPVALTLLAGCQAMEQFTALPPRDLAPPQMSPATPSARPASLASAKSPVQPAEFQTSVADSPPMPETESPTPVTVKPVSATTLTLADLERMALDSNPAVARAAALVQAARGQYVQVGLPPNPSVGYEGQQIGSRGLAEQDGVFVSQEIVRGGKLALNRQVAAQEWARAEQELAAQQQRVLTDVRVAFYQIVIAQRQEQFTGELLRLSREGLTVAEDLQRGKEVGKVDVVQAQLEAENAEILARNALNRRLAAWQELAAVVGDANLPPRPLVDEMDEVREEVKWEESLQRVLSNSPEIAAAMTDIERSRWAVQRALVEKTPNVTVQGLVNWRDNGIGGRSDGALTVGIPLPLWNRNQGSVIQTQNEAAAAERALEQLELDLQKRLSAVYERYANARQQTQRYRAKILPAAQESLNLTRQLYQAGETGYVNLLTAQRTYSQTNLNYLESLRELRKAEAEIDGLLLSNSLERR